MRSRRKAIIFILALLCCAAPAFSQEPDTAVNASGGIRVEEESYNESSSADDTDAVKPVVYNAASPAAAQWQKATSGDDYGYRSQREYVKKEEPPEEIPWWYRLLVNIARFLGSTFGKILLWGVIILIVGYIVYRIVAGQGSGLFGKRDVRQAPTAESSDVSAESLQEADWEARLKAALGAGDTRSAIRFSYLHMLQLLQEKSLIRYSPDKTNIAYYRELAEKPALRQPFRDITRQYEYAWYGNFLPAPAALDAYLQTYEGLKKSISQS